MRTTAPLDELPTVLTPREVAELMGLSAESVRRMCASGTLPAFKVGKSWRVVRDRLLAGAPE